MRKNAGMRAIEALCWTFFAGCLLLIFHELLLALFKEHNWKPPASGDWATWAGALGTTIAFAGTIWIATEEWRQRRSDAHTAARITAANVYFQAVHNGAHTTGAIQALQAAFNGNLHSSAPAQDILKMASIAVVRLKNVRPINARDLQTLSVLPDDRAVDLATAQARVASVMALLKGAPTFENDLPTLIPHLFEHLRQLKVAEASFLRGSRALGEMVDLVGVSPPQ
jgi:hypothetical protein